MVAKIVTCIIGLSVKHCSSLTLLQCFSDKPTIIIRLLKCHTTIFVVTEM